MSSRELIVLGTASQVPTRARNHNGYVLRWEDEMILFDPGEGSQRQLRLAGVPAARITKVCITHFHGDHCLGLPGVLQRRVLDGITDPVDVWFPADGAPVLERLLSATHTYRPLRVRPHPIEANGLLHAGRRWDLHATRLDHGPTPVYGYALRERDARHMLPERLQAAGVTGPDVTRLQEAGSIKVGNRLVRLEEVSAPRPGRRFAFVMDTRPCEGAFELADRADMLLCEATFGDEHAFKAAAAGHMTARQAGMLAAACGVRRLVLSHFSQRYPDEQELARQAGEVFPDVVAARDLDVLGFPPTRRGA